MKETKAHRGRLSVIVGYEKKEEEMKKKTLVGWWSVGWLLCTGLVGMFETERQRETEKEIGAIVRVRVCEMIICMQVFLCCFFVVAGC
jgi:hypothetical protein